MGKLKLIAPLLWGLLVLPLGAEPATAPPVVVERLTELYGTGQFRSLPQKDPLGHLLALQKQNWPRAWVSSTFYDWRTTSQYRRKAGLHLGYDIALPFGAAVSAGWPGTVTAVVPWTRSEYGVSVTDPSGTTVTYGHITPSVAVGQTVQVGQTIGRIASDHVDVKMRDHRGNYLPFGEEHSGTRVASYPRMDRNALLTSWLVAHSTAQQAADELFYAENASKKWELEARGAKRRMESLDRTLEQVREARDEGLLSRRRFEELKAERAAAHKLLEKVQSQKSATPKQLRENFELSRRQLESFAAWAKAEGLSWADVERLVDRTKAGDKALAESAARQQKSLSSRSLPLPQLKSRIQASSQRLEKLEELYQAGGLSRSEIEDQRLAHQLLIEEYDLRLRRKNR